MDQADDELRVTIKSIWPLQAEKILDLLVPRVDQLNKTNLTVGKIYGGLLILDSWRTTKFGKLKTSIGVSSKYTFILYSFCINWLFVLQKLSLKDIDNQQQPGDEQIPIEDRRSVTPSSK